jgi:4-aminobutyrate aminotransferase-like enzyme
MSRLERGDLPPAILVAPPGPASRELSARLASHEAPGINTLGIADQAAVVWREALGANVVDVDGNRYIDLTGGFGVAAVGHRHPRVVAAVRAQTERLVHGLGDVAAHPARIELAERLSALAPLDEPRVHFAVSGADAVEIALKTALAATGRPRVIAFDPAYHGATLGALAVSSRAEFRAPFAAHLHPHVVRLPFGCATPLVDDELARGDCAALLVEPVAGREGVRVPPAGWLSGLARVARDHGALLVVDEILTGGGRTGTLFAVEQEGVRPDLLCCGKALAGGLPFGAVIGSRALLEVWRTAGEALHTGTFVAHPLACAAALATLHVIDDESLVARAAQLAALVVERFDRITGLPGVRSLRGVGALWGVELEDPGRARRAASECRAAGVLLLSGGASARVLQIAPPLVITDDQFCLALDIVQGAIAASETTRDD